jgi:FkbM family methyltransferase
MREVANRALQYEFCSHFWWNEIIRNYLNTKREQIKTIIDIGANIGTATRFFLDTLDPKIIHSFEPDPENFSWLKKLTKDDRVKFYPYGIYYGATESKVAGVELFGHVGYSCVSALDDEHKFAGTVNYDDKIFQLRELEPFVDYADMIKLDCEGAEFNIIENSEFVRNTDIVLAEFHNHEFEYFYNFINTHFPNHKIIDKFESAPYLLTILEK